MARAVKPTKKATDRRRAGVGDNVAFTARVGSGGLGTGQRISNITSPALAQHQYTNRVGGTVSGNGSPVPKPAPKPTAKNAKKVK
jgi:hypothetical protein